MADRNGCVCCDLAGFTGKHRKTVHGSCSSRNTGNDRAGTEG